MKRPIYEKLLKFQKENRYPFHMPGHKRRLTNEISAHMFQWDITEIDGFDELFDPSGIIKESMEGLKEFYKTKKTWYLVNGSSSGNMAAIGGTFHRGEGILLGRNCHASVYRAVELFGLKPYYIYPSYEEKWKLYGAVIPEEIDQILRNNREIKGVVITSPTYEGVVSDIHSISKVCKKYNAVLIVDEAHGAHFPFSEYFPKSAVECGADLVIQSLHKTMAVPNQGALLHLSSNRVKMERIEHYQAMFQTTSPSYVLLASMEYGIDHGRESQEEWRQYEQCLDEYRKKWEDLKVLHLLEPSDLKKGSVWDYDRGKLVITTNPAFLTGKELKEELLNKYHLQMEMCETNYVIAMTSYIDEMEAFCRLDEALTKIDQRLEKQKRRIINQSTGKNQKYQPLSAAKWERIYTPSEAVEKRKRKVNLKDAEGKIAGSYIYLYPPGSPILVPGEKINIKVLEKIEEYLYNKMEVKGLQDNKIDIIE
ncbi:MAG: aminotransferase class I/II-fold pyridoxal phosphate-dependent enzyme [Lachnospiraceae bacterium]|nr:aminotransferase class I/II-fold pyridoxal phosphate-dependent enzyme [Lachnospiraceae bacterium]